MNKRHITRGLSLALVMFLTASCGADDGDSKDGYEVSQSTLTGTVGGEAFEVRGGFAEDKFGDGEYWVELHNEPLEEPCGFNQSTDGPKIILSVTPEPMDEPLSFQNNITFSYGDAQNDIATQGRLIIDGAEGDTLSGGLYAVMDANEVDGTFSVPICPSE